MEITKQSLIIHHIEGDRPMTHFDKPQEGEYARHDIQYIKLVPADGMLLKHLEDNLADAQEFFRSMPEEKLVFRYAEGKWTVKEILGHINDCERIYAYRALRFARNDSAVLPGYEQDDYVKVQRANERGLEDLLEEFAAVRASSIALLKSFDADALDRGGVASGRRLTVRAAAYIIVGHQLHHMNIIKERYL